MEPDQSRAEGKANWWHVLMFLLTMAGVAWAGGWVFAWFSWDKRAGYALALLLAFTVLGLAPEVTQFIWLLLLAVCAPIFLGHHFAGTTGAAVAALGSAVFLVACWRLGTQKGEAPSGSTPETSPAPQAQVSGPAGGGELAGAAVEVAFEGIIEAVTDL